jgi:hypothetical protein
VGEPFIEDFGLLPELAEFLDNVDHNPAGEERKIRV